MIRPIETMWRGFRFRSRTEARWAVFLTAAGINFEYEAEGFALPSGWYLPDFWLPERKLWLEIKGDQPTVHELQKGTELAAASRHWLAFGIGAPDPDKYQLPCVDGEGNRFEVMLEGPARAYAAARAERFDGKGVPAENSRPPRWY
jgi:hypothetical protein